MRMSKLLSLGAAAFVFIAIISLALVPKHALAGGLYVTELETILGQPSGVLFRADPVTGSEISGAQLSDFAGPVRSETSIAFAPDLATTAVPEPSSVGLIVAFLTGFGVVRFRAHFESHQQRAIRRSRMSLEAA